MSLRRLLGALLVTATAACGTSAQVPQSKYPAHGGRVFVTKDIPPYGAPIEVIGPIELESGSYGSLDPFVDELADHARQVGADAVIRLRTGRKVGAFAWAVPYANGIAVRSHGFDFARAGMTGEFR